MNILPVFLPSTETLVPAFLCSTETLVTWSSGCSLIPREGSHTREGFRKHPCPSPLRHCLPQGTLTEGSGGGAEQEKQQWKKS